MLGHKQHSLAPIVPSPETPGEDMLGDSPSYNFVVADARNADSAFTAVLTPLSHVHDIAQCQNLRIDPSQNPEYVRATVVPFIDCDFNASTINSLIATMQSENVACGVFYSSAEAGCMVAPDQEWIKSSLPNLFTMSSASAAVQIMSMLAPDTEVRGTITPGTKASTSSSGTGGLIALYAALGVFVFVLLLVLIGGIIRMCRHPERYNSDGTGEERARGLARAMLDTVPLVRVDNGRAARNREGRSASLDAESQAEAGPEKAQDETPPADAGEKSNARSTNDISGDSTHDGRPSGGSTSAPAPAEKTPTTAGGSPSPPIISAPAPAKVNTYAFSGGVRTPQRTPLQTPRMTPRRTSGTASERTPQARSASVSPGAEVAPTYSTDGFPFPLMHDNVPNMSLETIDENKAANKPQAASSTPQLSSSVLGQSPIRSVNSPAGKHSLAAVIFPTRAARHIDLPSNPPPARRRGQRKQENSTSSTSISSTGSNNGMSSTKSSKTSEKSAASQANGDSDIGVYVNHDDDVCSICFEEFKAGDLLRALPCSHHFHATCVDPWLLKSSSKCPLCRTDLRTINPGTGATSSAQTREHAHGLGHTFRFMKQRIRRVSESLKPDSRAESKPQHDVRSERQSAADGSNALPRSTAPSLRRSNTAPAHRLLRLLPMTPSTAHLLRPNRQTEQAASNTSELARN